MLSHTEPDSRQNAKRALQENSADAQPLLAAALGISNVVKEEEEEEILNPLDMEDDDDDLLVSFFFSPSSSLIHHVLTFEADGRPRTAYGRRRTNILHGFRSSCP